MTRNLGQFKSTKLTGICDEAVRGNDQLENWETSDGYDFNRGRTAGAHRAIKRDAVLQLRLECACFASGVESQAQGSFDESLFWRLLP